MGAGCEAGVRGWRKVEAVRRALFESAHGTGRIDERLGRGVLQAAAPPQRAPDAGNPQSL